MILLKNHINGLAADGLTAEYRDVVNPYTEQPIARIPVGSSADVEAAMQSASAAQLGWASLSLKERLNHLQRTAEILDDHVRELAELESLEMGKPIPLAEQFIRGAIDSLRTTIEQARAYQFVANVSQPGETSRTIVTRRPLGVVALIAPWNFTVTSILSPLGPLLAAGNTVVVKPSEKAPLSAARLLELIDVPPGVTNLLLGDARAGVPLAEHEDVALVHFTGSVETGRSVGVAAARRLRRSVLELGGNDPVIVDNDADVNATAKAVATSTFLNSGQICTSTERIYVHRDIAEAFTHALVREAESFDMVDSPECFGLGPMVDDGQRQMVHAHVIDAESRGATVRCGGRIPDRRGFFYPATVLTGVTPDMQIMVEETFGPVAPITVVDSFDEAIALANGTGFGLAATVYSRNPLNLQRCSEINAAIVWINEWQSGGAHMIYEPWGLSGVGMTGGFASFDAATRPVSIVSPAETP
ncbi:aldehyde dehydrogenase [Arthrobacter sp. 4R501]|uniref:aldehyde dehydrogenase family protein n=1 Tax=Arthrobacter sp. 4R501 TaxID=2058886 RepID=UPI000CE37592|nr:aldehyde dehydrogenase family protein [Arthrobacter sp. 4R501]